MRQHGRKQQSREPYERRHVDLHHLLQPREVAFGNGAEIAEARVVDEDIHADALFPHEAEHILRRAGIGKVAGQDIAADGEFFPDLRPEVCQRAFAAGDEDEVAPVRGGEHGKFPAQTARGAGDERRSVACLHHSPPILSK